MWIPIFIIAAITVSVNGVLDIDIKKYEPCDMKKDYQIKHHANFTKINSTHILADGGSIHRYPLDHTIMVDFVLERYEDNDWTPIITYKKPDPCKALNKYGGDLFYSIEERAGITPGICPIPEGNYELKDVWLDFNNFPIKTARPGPYRALAKAFKGDIEIFCYNVEIVLQ